MPSIDSAYRVNRGGAFGYGASHARSAFRFYVTPEYQDGFLGLRVARVLTP